jgi:hypothetical protein
MFLLRCRPIYSFNSSRDSATAIASDLRFLKDSSSSSLLEVLYFAIRLAIWDSCQDECLSSKETAFVGRMFMVVRKRGQGSFGRNETQPWQLGTESFSVNSLQHVIRPFRLSLPQFVTQEREEMATDTV